MLRRKTKKGIEKLSTRLVARKKSPYTRFITIFSFQTDFPDQNSFSKKKRRSQKSNKTMP
jgi:hypothetical protein